MQALPEAARASSQPRPERQSSPAGTPRNDA